MSRWIGVVMLSVLAACSARQVENQINIVYSGQLHAYYGQLAFPTASTIFTEYTPEQAYRTQGLLVAYQRRNNPVVGYKAGLTARPVWEKFGLHEPLAGVLLASHRVIGTHVDPAGYRDLRVETEIAFVLGTAITAPVATTAALMQHIAAIAPAIELPDLGFRDMENLRGVDIIAANASAAGFMLGTTVAVNRINPQDVHVTLRHDGDVIGQGRGSDVMGDPWEAARWLVNKMLVLGYAPQAGDVLFTGAIGGLHPGTPGRYTADFGELGEMAFEVVPPLPSPQKIILN